MRQHFGIHAHAPQEEAWKNRFLLDMDGNALSGRFYALLSLSLPLKVAYYREWHSLRSFPWKHHVPLSASTDEYAEVLRYFEEEEDGMKIARALASRGHDWAERTVRQVDMQVYMFRLLLEYGRLVDDIRHHLGYKEYFILYTLGLLLGVYDIVTSLPHAQHHTDGVKLMSYLTPSTGAWTSVPCKNNRTRALSQAMMQQAVERRDCVFGRDAARQQLWKFLGREKIVVAHGGHNDLSVLRMCCQKIHRSSSGWGMPRPTTGQPYANPPMVHSYTMPPNDDMSLELESEDSDVSRTHDSHYRAVSVGTVDMPLVLPPQPPKHVLESSDVFESRIRDLQRVESININKSKALKGKRQRKDEKIARRREAQDRKINAIIEARRCKDERIVARRKREDDAFSRFWQDIEDEEDGLRRRLRRLKRGLPVDESPQHGTTLSSASISPPSTAPSGLPPPAKRHQTNPPGQLDSPFSSHPYPSNTHSMPLPNRPPPMPHYTFYTYVPPAYRTMPYHRSPGFRNPPQHGPEAFTPQPGPNPGLTPNQIASFSSSARPPTPQSRPLLLPGRGSNASAPSSAPRQSSSRYDTRPPPPSTGFATINGPPQSGFAAINPRSADTPPVQHSTTVSKLEVLPPQAKDAPETDRKPYVSENGTPMGGPDSNKRTPSTTHLYQMSEAFANRHHHCERVDNLNRGIWTSFGRDGTGDNPTGPPVEMYLRCNHDNCTRIDWRTIHGLQCHIVKSHEQPKGTIGGLEKALNRYGVPVREVVGYEKEHGEGSGGTVADTKTAKVKVRRGAGRKGTPTDPGTPTGLLNETVPLAGWRPPNAAFPAYSPSSNKSLLSGHPHDEMDYPDDEGDVSQPGPLRMPLAPTSKFTAVRGDWTHSPGARGGQEISRDQEIASRAGPPRPPSPLRMTQFHDHYVPTSRLATSTTVPNTEPKPAHSPGLLKMTNVAESPKVQPAESMPSSMACTNAGLPKPAATLTRPDTANQGKKLELKQKNPSNTSRLATAPLVRSPTTQTGSNAPIMQSIEQRDPKEREIEAAREVAPRPPQTNGLPQLDQPSKAADPDKNPQSDGVKGVPMPDILSPAATIRSLTGSTSPNRSSQRSSLAAAEAVYAEPEVDTSRAATATKALVDVGAEKDKDKDKDSEVKQKEKEKEKPKAHDNKEKTAPAPPPPSTTVSTAEDGEGDSITVENTTARKDGEKEEEHRDREGGERIEVKDWQREAAKTPPMPRRSRTGRFLRKTRAWTSDYLEQEL